MSSTQAIAPKDRVEVLKRVIKIAHQVQELDSVLEIIMDHLIELLAAERGFIMLYDKDSGSLEFQTARNLKKEELYGSDFQLSRSILFHCYRENKALIASNALEDERFSQAQSIKDLGLRSLMCAPLAGSEGPIGVFYVDNRTSIGAFQSSDLSFLESFAAQAAAVLERTRLKAERDRVHKLFSHYLAQPIVEQILARPSEALSASRRRVTVMFSDLRGFSQLAESLDPAELLGFLNSYFEVTAAIISSHEGILLSFMGDGILAVFGAPLAIKSPETKAVKCAKEMVKNALERKLRIGVGLATGEAVLGDLGTTSRRSYTVIGDIVNTSARLEKLTKVKGEAILCDKETYCCSGANGLALGAELLEGKHYPTEVFTP